MRRAVHPTLPLPRTRRPAAARGAARSFIPLLCAGLAGGAVPAWAAGSLVLMDAPPAQTSWSGGASTRSWPSAPGSRAREQ
ncbi:hypothetical protein ACFJIX_22495 [Roseateles sp. UC29_93]|uniref:hypothetical protein n=1 Tax=Roseateles sp. UC29_93 TaxID=3350177 RepID=UPI00366F8EE3